MVEHRGELGLEVKTLRVLGDQLGQAWLEDRNVSRPQIGDSLRIDVTAPHVVAQLGEAGGTHQAHPSDADDADRSFAAAHVVRLSSRGRSA